MFGLSLCYYTKNSSFKKRKNKKRKNTKQTQVISLTACRALFSARTTPQPSQNLVEPWRNFGGNLMEPSWKLTSGPPRTPPEPIWAETPKLSPVGEKGETIPHTAAPHVTFLLVLVGTTPTPRLPPLGCLPHPPGARKMGGSGAAHIEPWAEDMGWDAQRWRRAQLGRHERCGGLLWSPFGLI